MKVRNLVILFVMLVLTMTFALAIPFTPQGNIDLKNVYGMINAVSVNGTSFYADYFYGIYDWSENSVYLSFNGTILYLNDTKLNRTFITIAQEGHINANSSQYWKLLSTPADIKISDLNDSGEEYLDVNSSDYWDKLNTPADILISDLNPSGEADLNVNSSDHWDNLDTVNTTVFNNETSVLGIVQSWWDGLYCLLTGCTMTGDIDMGENEIYNVSKINSTVFYQDGQRVIDWGNEGDLNVNSSNYWDKYNIPTDLNYLLLLYYVNITDRPLYLSNFTNDENYITNATMNRSIACADIDGTTSNLCTIVDTDRQMGTDGLYLYNDTTTHNFNETKLNATIDDRSTNINTKYTGDNVYIYNMSEVMTFNETKMNLTIAATDVDDSNASTACSGATTYLNGENGCVDISGVYAGIAITQAYDSNASTACSGSTTYLTGENTCVDISAVYAPIAITQAYDSNASTACAGAFTYLNGEDACVDIQALASTSLPTFVNLTLTDSATISQSKKICLNGVACTSYIYNNGSGVIIV